MSRDNHFNPYGWYTIQAVPPSACGGGHIYMIGHGRRKDVAESSEHESETPE